jgi:regulator of sigma E protease
MVESPGWAFMVLAFLVVIGPLVFVHELGHYLVARWCGVRADVFSIGFGRAIVGWTDRRGTKWKVGWLPLGGYVKFAGDMNPASQPSDEWLALPPEERAKTFQAKPLWQRFLIVAAGPVTNFLLAVLIFIGVFATIGYPTTPAIVTGVVTGAPADRAGIAPGDRIVGADGEEIRTFEELQTHVRLRPAATIDLTVARGEQRLPISVRTDATDLKDQFGNQMRVGTLGVVSNAVAIEKVPPLELPGLAVRQTVTTLEAITVTLGQLLVGERSVKELGGPLKMAQISGQQASLGWLPLFWLMAVISINLGFINLLPIPMLDGGHLLFYVIEGARRKPLQPKAQEWAFRAGLAALLMLMIFVTLNDLASFGLWSRLGGLIG